MWYNTTMIKFTIFNSLFDNKTDKRVELEDFDAFERMLYELSKIPRSGKKDAQLISPATYPDGTTRKNDTVLEWSGWCAVDVDDIEFDGDLNEYLVERFAHYRWVCYSTASSTSDNQKFRLVFPLEKPVDVSNIKSFWFALQTELGELGDKQTKDLSRMYYVPGDYTGAYNFIFSHRDGSAINPDELIFKHPMPVKNTLNSFFDRLPESLQTEIIEYRKNKLDQNFEWSSYHDCPFWPKKLANEYKMITKTGWYAKMYSIMIATAGSAINKKYPISAEEISLLCRQFDQDTGNWYKNRPLDKEADRAIEYVYKNI